MKGGKFVVIGMGLTVFPLLVVVLGHVTDMKWVLAGTIRTAFTLDILGFAALIILYIAMLVKASAKELQIEQSGATETQRQLNANGKFTITGSGIDKVVMWALYGLTGIIFAALMVTMESIVVEMAWSSSYSPFMRWLRADTHTLRWTVQSFTAFMVDFILALLPILVPLLIYIAAKPRLLMKNQRGKRQETKLPYAIPALEFREFNWRTTDGQSRSRLETRPADGQWQRVLGLWIGFTVIPTAIVETLTLHIQQEQIPALEWKAETFVMSDGRYAEFALPDSITGGPHTIHVVAVSNEEEWPSQPITVQVPRP